MTLLAWQLATVLLQRLAAVESHITGLSPQIGHAIERSPAQSSVQLLIPASHHEHQSLARRTWTIAGGEDGGDGGDGDEASTSELKPHLEENMCSPGQVWHGTFCAEDRRAPRGYFLLCYPRIHYRDMVGRQISESCAVKTHCEPYGKKHPPGVWNFAEHGDIVPRIVCEPDEEDSSDTESDGDMDAQDDGAFDYERGQLPHLDTADQQVMLDAVSQMLTFGRSLLTRSLPGATLSAAVMHPERDHRDRVSLVDSVTQVVGKRGEEVVCMSSVSWSDLEHGLSDPGRSTCSPMGTHDFRHGDTIQFMLLHDGFLPLDTFLTWTVLGSSAPKLHG